MTGLGRVINRLNDFEHFHRVIAADLSIVGFQGKREGTAIQQKKALLASEGVVFDADGKLADPSILWRFETQKCAKKAQ